MFLAKPTRGHPLLSCDQKLGVAMAMRSSHLWSERMKEFLRTQRSAPLPKPHTVTRTRTRTHTHTHTHTHTKPTPLSPLVSYWLHYNVVGLTGCQDQSKPLQ